jgi:hypothetical protein
MGNISSFGIGCFHLSTRVKVPSEFDVAHYAQMIREFLGSIETVEDFSVEEEEGERTFQVTEAPISMREGGLFPGSVLRSVDFSLRIPQRTQLDIIKSIHGSEVAFTETGTEQFSVRTEYFYYGPVTVVECKEVEHAGANSPSEAIIIVREYLKRKANEFASDVLFEVVGPSPFHANFFVIEDDEVKKSFVVDHDASPGYDRIAFRVTPQPGISRTIWLLDRIGTPLSYFYSLERMRSALIREWSTVKKRWGDVCGDEPTGAIDRFRSLRKRRANIADLLRGINSFRVGTVLKDQEAKFGRAEISKYELPEFLEKHITDATEETFVRYPTEEMLELVRFNEERGARWLDRASVFFAAIMGGMIGAAITLLTQ